MTNNKENKKPINGFSKTAWILLFFVIITLLGSLLFCRFWFGDNEYLKDRMIFVEMAIGMLIWVVVSTWLAISKSQNWPVFKAMRRSKDPNNKSPKILNNDNDEDKK